MMHCTGMEFDENKSVRRKRDGYLLIYAPWHPKAWSSCRLMPLHRLVVESHIGRILSSDEHVHHIDGNKLNNSPENLQVISSSEHTTLHFYGGVGGRATMTCSCCGAVVDRMGRMRYCSRECYLKSGEKNKCSDSQVLEAHRMLRGKPMRRIASALGISDVALKKRLIRLGLL